MPRHEWDWPAPRRSRAPQRPKPAPVYFDADVGSWRPMGLLERQWHAFRRKKPLIRYTMVLFGVTLGWILGSALWLALGTLFSQ